MTMDEYQRALKEAMYRAMYSDFAMRGDTTPRNLNPEFKATPKSTPLEKVRLLSHQSDKHGTLFVVQSLTGVETYAPLADADGTMLLIPDKAEAARAVKLCQKMVSSFQSSAYGSAGGYR